MADGHFTDVELLRRELATLILEWAGEAVKDDPDGPLSTALTRAVGDVARTAVAEQHQALTAETADRIAEALDRRGRTGIRNAPSWVLALFAVAVAALAAIAFFLGVQFGRSETVSPPTAASTGVNAPIAPLAPSAEDPEPGPAAPRAAEAKPTPRAQRPPPTSKPAVRAQPRDLGRPAPASDSSTLGSAQPVGAAPPAAASTTTPKP